MIEVSRAAVIAAYELLRTQRPFLGWKLPDADEVGFEVMKGHRSGWFADCDGETIRVARSRHGHLNTLLMSLAHEAIHLHQFRRGLETPNTEHNADFVKRAKRICAIHGWDYRCF